MKAKATIAKKGDKKDEKKDDKSKKSGSKPKFWEKKKKAVKESDGYNQPEDQDEEEQDEDTKSSTEPVSEVRILTFSQFINEDEDFVNQYMPKPEDDTSDSDSDPTMTAEPNAPEAGADDDNDDDGGNEPTDTDDWNKPEPDSGFDIDNGPKAGEISKRPTKVDKLNTQLGQVSTQIAKYLDKYKAGSMTIQQYKEVASPLLAQRKELQAKLDSYFNVSLTSDDDDSIPAGLDDDHGTF